MTGANVAQAVVFGLLANPGSTRAEVHQAAVTLGLEISAPGLDKRFTARGVVFLDGLLQVALQQLVEAEPLSQTVLSRFAGVYVMDSSVVGMPAALQSVWPSGTDADGAAVKLAVRWDLRAGGLGIWLRPGRVHDQRTPVSATALPAGSVRLADLGFFNLKQFQQDQTQGVCFFSRYKLGTHLFTPRGEPLDLLALLRRQPQATLDLPVLAGELRLPCRLIALPTPAPAVAQRHQRLRNTARRKQQACSPLALALAAWTLYLTNIPPTLLAPHEAHTLGITRWQIERLFYLWKQHGQLDQSRSHDPWRVWCEFYAKLLGLLVQHWLTLLGCWSALNRSLFQAAQLIRKHAFHLALLLSNPPALTHALIRLARALLRACRLPPRRSHPLTFQLWLETMHP